MIFNKDRKRLGINYKDAVKNADSFEEILNKILGVLSDFDIMLNYNFR